MGIVIPALIGVAGWLLLSSSRKREKYLMTVTNAVTKQSLVYWTESAWPMIQARLSRVGTDKTREDHQATYWEQWFSTHKIRQGEVDASQVVGAGIATSQCVVVGLTALDGDLFPYGVITPSRAHLYAAPGMQCAILYPRPPADVVPVPDHHDIPPAPPPEPVKPPPLPTVVYPPMPGQEPPARNADWDAGMSEIDIALAEALLSDPRATSAALDLAAAAAAARGFRLAEKKFRVRAAQLRGPGGGPVTPPGPPPVAARRTYVIRAGDTAYGLSQRYTGDGNRWREILTANPSLKTVQVPHVTFDDDSAGHDADSGGGSKTTYITQIRPWNPGQTINLPDGW